MAIHARLQPTLVLHICVPKPDLIHSLHSVIHSFQLCKSPPVAFCCYPRRCGSLAAFKALLDNTSAHASMLKQNLSLRSLFVRCTSGITQPTPLAASFLPLCFSHSARTGEEIFGSSCKNIRGHNVGYNTQSNNGLLSPNKNLFKYDSYS
jgi:hypothetical protein